MNERTAKSARLGSGAGHQLTATRTRSQFSEKPRSGRIRTGEKGELVDEEVFKSSRANPGSFACQQLAPLAFRTERYTHSPSLWLKCSSPGTSRQCHEGKIISVISRYGGEEVGRTAPEGQQAKPHPQFPSRQYPETVCWKSSPVPTLSLGFGF